MKNKRLFLLDVMPLLYRAHFATMGKKFGTTTGIDTRTTLVFFNYIFQVITEERPDAIAAALDSKPKERTAVQSTYKANRDKMPSEIFEAFPYAMQLLNALNIPVLKEEGFEADDVIAAMAKQGESNGYEVYIVSPDKDFAQLVTNKVFLFRPAYKGAVMETLDVAGVQSKYGVPPGKIADYLALRGDSVDNIIGIKGIGDKTAAQLLNDFDSIEHLIESADAIKQVKTRESILEFKEQLIENKQLATLTGELDITIDWDDIKVKQANTEQLVPLLDELQFAKIKERIAKLGLIELQQTEEVVSNPVVTMRSVSINNLIAELKLSKMLALAFVEEQPDKLFITAREQTELFEVEVRDEKEWKQLIQFLDENAIVKTGWQLKPLIKHLFKKGITLKSTWTDLTIAAYLLNSDTKIEWQLIKDKYQLDQHSIKAANTEISFLPSLIEAHQKIMEQIEAMQLTSLLNKIELPLLQVIAKMELHGIKVDLDALKEIDKLLSKQLKELEKTLYASAGRKFNIGSPAQTAEILQIICDPSELKKTKTGQISTAEPFLIDLAPKYPFIDDLLNYRKLNKIITTYVYSLPKYVHPATNKIHPTFSQLVAGTGRLSCTEPNLQNLPIRSEAGREVRKSIVPSTDGFSILSVDYNQVELRLLAALSGDKVMLDTFQSGQDIHTATASRIFKVDDGAVTKDMRNKAKGVNFGIAYGITPWGLATRLKISQKEAKDIIEAYFQQFSSVKEYLERSIDESRKRGYTKTLYGRIRYIEGIDSRNGTTRKVAERMAVNAPLQGLAADIIKEAMVNIDDYINSNNLQSRLILQVHDELVFDAADEELARLVPKVVELMETKAELMVPLKVHVTVGKNWLDQADYFS